MGKRNNIIQIFSFLLLPILIGIMLKDLMYTFGNYDTPFIVGIGIYFVFCLIAHASSRWTFGLVSLLVVCMGISYMIMGPYRRTERLGEWVYLFFVFGLIQYTIEAIHEKK
jgi:hypothetical protein